MLQKRLTINRSGGTYIVPVVTVRIFNRTASLMNIYLRATSPILKYLITQCKQVPVGKFLAKRSSWDYSTGETYSPLYTVLVIAYTWS